MTARIDQSTQTDSGLMIPDADTAHKTVMEEASQLIHDLHAAIEKGIDRKNLVEFRKQVDSISTYVNEIQQHLQSTMMQAEETLLEDVDPPDDCCSPASTALIMAAATTVAIGVNWLSSNQINCRIS